MGYHAGLGAELRVGKRLAIHGDYRYNHIRFGGSPTEPEKAQASPSAIAVASTAITLLPKLTAIQRSLKDSNHGSMWNWGLTVFF